jgi:hypothetical protein
MNFKELNSFIRGIEEGTVSECGDMPSLGMSTMGHGRSEQQDNVSMNVSMNGAGKNGIRDLMDLLKNIDDIQDGSESDVDVLLTSPEESEYEMGEEYANQPDEVTHDIAAVTPTGNDLASKGKEAPRMNGGGNPMSETLKSRLRTLYNEVKNR